MTDKMLLKLAGSAILIGTAGLACAPAHAEAGPFDFVKKQAEKMVKKEAASLIEAHAPMDSGEAVVQLAGLEEAEMSQNGTSVETAAELAAQTGETATVASTQTGDFNGDGVMDVLIVMSDGATKIVPGTAPQPAKEPKLRQNGTTVPTASEVQAPQREGEAGMLLPAVQRAREPSARATKPARGKGVSGEAIENGKIDPNAKPEREGRLARAGFSQNGTTVETADTKQAPTTPQRADAEPQDAYMIIKRGPSGPIVEENSEGKPVEGDADYTYHTDPADPQPLTGDEHEIEYDVTAGVDKGLIDKVEAPKPARAGRPVEGDADYTFHNDPADPQPARQKEPGLSQNRTTVPTANTVQAPKREGEAIGSSTGGAGGAGKVKFEHLSIKKRN